MVRKNRWLQRAVTGVAVLTVVGCATVGKELVTEDEIQRARSEGQLVALYERLEQDKMSALPKAKAQLQRMSVMIAEDFHQSFYRILGDGRGDLVPLSVLQQQQLRINQLRRWDVKAADDWQQTWNRQQQRTQQQIQALQRQMLPLAHTQLDEQLLLADQIGHLQAQLAGVQSAREAVYDDCYQQANKAELREDWALALAIWQRLIDVERHFRDTPDRYNEALYQHHSRVFLQAFGVGDTDAAYAAFEALAKQPALLSRMQEKLLELAQFYQLQGDAQLSDGLVIDSFKSLMKAKNLSEALQVDSASDAEEVLVQQVFSRFENARSGNHWGAAMGYLLAMQALRPAMADWPRLERETRQALYDRAVTRVSAGKFGSPNQHPDLGRKVGSLVIQQLLAGDLQHIRLVERDKLDTVVKEQEIKAIQKGTSISLDSADVLIEGDVLEARVDTSEQSISRTKRVVVEKKPVANPAYAAWKEMSSSERRGIPQPPVMVDVDVKENVRIGGVHIRKHGSISAAYRVIDPATAKLVKIETIDEQISFEGEQADGMEIGLFVQQPQRADIPSDGEILSQLAEKISNRIAEAMKDLFTEPHQAQLQKYELLLSESNFGQAVESLGDAYALLQTGSKQHIETESQLMELALQLEPDAY